MIVQNVSTEGHTDMTFTVARGDMKRALALVEDVARELGAAGVKSDSGIAKVSVVGLGMKDHAGVAGKMFAGAVASTAINIQMINTSEIKISVVIDEKYTELACRALHDAFELGGIARGARGRPRRGAARAPTRTRRARWLWAAVVGAALAFARARPAAPGPLALAARHRRVSAGAPAARRARACGCAATAAGARAALGLPPPLNVPRAARARARRAGSARCAPRRSRPSASRGGPFGSLDELAQRVPGIGPKTVDRIRPRLFAVGPDPALWE